MRLGARHTAAPASVPHLAARATLSTVTPPVSCDWHSAYPGLGDALGNDTIGCCVPAWDYVELAMRLANAARDTWRPTAADVAARYSLLTGYDPATGQPDDGTDTAADAAQLCSVGLVVNSQLRDVPHWTLVDHTNTDHLKIAASYFGGVALTVNLCAAMRDMDWRKPPGAGPDWVPGSWGMHRLGSGFYDEEWFTLRTWGKDVSIHPELLAHVLVGAECRVSRWWCDASGITPSGVDWDALMADRAALVG